MVDAIGPKRIDTITRVHPVAEEGAEESKREQQKQKRPDKDKDAERLGGNVDERC